MLRAGILARIRVPPRTFLLVCLAALITTLFVSHIRDTAPRRRPHHNHGGPKASEHSVSGRDCHLGKNSSSLNLAFPTRHFRDNLRNDTYYITSWAKAGFTNMFISYMHLIYLGFLSDRVPILPPFVPDDHIPQSAGALPFTSVFKFHHLRQHLRISILEWSQVKRLPGLRSSNPNSLYSNPNVESIGCWSTLPEEDGQFVYPRNTEKLLGLDVAYTKVPRFTRMDPNDDRDPNVKFHSLSVTITPKHSYAPSDSYPLAAASPSGVNLPPDEHLSCYDSLYFATSGVSDLEWRYSWGPAWRRVGTHLRFTDHLVDLTKNYLRQAFAVPPGGELPPLITVHIRRGDFANLCHDEQPCLIEPSKFASAVSGIRQKLSDDQGLNVTHVFVTSDEVDPQFWKTIDGFGWKYINHARELTTERFGPWYPPLIDTVALSMGVGFVGTDKSTFSTLSAWRVKDWNRGETRLVTRED
ncbi:hypothetical protein CC1G_03261 [Coprinopsis cinerea okayama7|uniref:Uncharacterized protein n=1 Tax=Coprinopsis cinerea (strain Okayama-7 / 130 / ATCC MYA-4618 / FGSC 9003) TaxID=240176 RepID=A8N7B8_COPC7|nr:hypothetical protein CC1G_03261 [Coprinopsis cinerea okayama7\|eukprot:XP_001830724.2 hypothetical protein CC1G_03261 [Coprinopsis cinerea okayama7\